MYLLFLFRKFKLFVTSNDYLNSGLLKYSNTIVKEWNKQILLNFEIFQLKSFPQFI